MIKRKKFWALMLTLCLMCGMVSGFSVQPTLQVSAASSLSDIQKKQQAIQKKLNDAKKNIKNLSGKIGKEKEYQKQLSGEISLNQQKVNTLQQSIAAMNTQINSKNQEISTKQKEIAAKQTEIDATYETFKKRMRAMYMTGETSSLEMLLSAESFSDFLSNMEMMKAISNHDQQLVEELREQKAKQEQQKADIEKALAEIKTNKAEIVAQQQNIKSAQAELQQSYSKSKEAAQDYDALKDQYENNRDVALKEERAVEAEMQQWYKAHASNNSSGAVGDSKFIWPLPGYSRISSPYGPRWGGFHSGMDITGGGVFGANIVASSSGTVIQASGHYSYGNYIIVDHGGGYSTLYAHASSLLVSVGQKVSKGQAIAKVGSTGNSTGPHLHFEVRINGKHKNPAGYVHS